MRRTVFAALICLQSVGLGLASTDDRLESECEQAAAVDAALQMSASTYPSWIRRANLGERFAQLVVGLANTSVRVYLRDKADAVEGTKWLEEAAQRGSLFAMGQLSSIHWTRAGAERGYPKLQAAYAHRLARGDGVSKDLRAAVHWWTLAANEGSHISQARLSIAYDQGLGVERSPNEALKWALLAARPLQGVVMTSTWSMKSPQTLKTELSDEEIAAVDREVKIWITRYEEKERHKADANEKECGRREIFSNKGFW